MKNQTFVYRIAALISYPVGYFYVRYVLFGITGTHEHLRSSRILSCLCANSDAYHK